MSRRSRFNLRDLVLGGTIKATAEVKKIEAPKQPAMDEKEIPGTRNTDNAPAINQNLNTQDAGKKTEVSEPPQTSSAQVSEKPEVVAGHSELGMKAAQQPSLKEGAVDTKTEETDIADPIKNFMQRKLPSKIQKPINPDIISASVDTSTPEAERATTHAAVGVNESVVTEKIADAPSVKSNGERQGSDGTTEVSKPVNKVSSQEDGAAGAEEIDEDGQIKNNVALLRIFPSVNPTPGSPFFSSQILEWTPAHVISILEKMECLDCNAIPSPNRLFQCPRGHLYCFECGAKRFTKDDKGDISSGTCDHEMNEEHSSTASGSTRGIGYGLIRPNFQLAEGEVEELSKDEQTGKAKCCLRIRKTKGDPLYEVIYNRTKWICPYAKFGCKEILFGSDIADHATPCMKKLGFL